MAEWKEKNLVDAVGLKRGIDLPTPQRRPGPYPVLGSSGISGWHDEAPVRGPGVTIGRSGASIGVATWHDGPFWPLNTTLYVTDFKGNDPRFIFRLLDGIDFASFNSGSAQPSLNRNFIAGIKVLIPPTHEQQAIADVLGALDDKIAINECIATTYERLFQYKFTQLGLSEEPLDSDAIPVTDLVSFNPKVEKPSTNEPVYVDMAALQTNRASIPSWTRREPKSGPRFMNGDTLMARITPCLENGKTGYVDFMEDDEVGVGSTEFIVMRSQPGVPKELSYFLARDERFREHAIRNMVGSSGRQRVSAADAANYFVNKPDSDGLAAFGTEVSAAFAHMKSLESESRRLATIRDTLLPQLMSGRLRVRDAEKIVEDAT